MLRERKKKRSMCDENSWLLLYFRRDARGWRDRALPDLCLLVGVLFGMQTCAPSCSWAPAGLVDTAVHRPFDNGGFGREAH